MAKSPDYKVYDADGNYQAAVKSAALGVVLAGFLGEGATVRYGHKRVVWVEGAEDTTATDSYDEATSLIIKRSAGVA